MQKKKKKKCCSLKDRSDSIKFTASLMKQVYLERCLEDNELCLGCGLKLL